MSSLDFEAACAVARRAVWDLDSARRERWADPDGYEAARAAAVVAIDALVAAFHLELHGVDAAAVVAVLRAEVPS